MDFQKKDWQFRDLITEDELNRMEDGIEEGITKAEQAQQTADDAQATANEANQIAEQAKQTAESHASRHASGGPDPITPAMIGAETPSGAQSKVNAHASRTDNPHGVTKAQVGLGNVQNYGIATQAQAEAGTANNVYMTPLRVAQAIAALSPGIKSVQRGSGTIPYDGQTVNVTISTINRNKAFVIAYSRGATDGFYHAITAELTSNTNLRITRGISNIGNSTPFTWEVVEFN